MQIAIKLQVGEFSPTHISTVHETLCCIYAPVSVVCHVMDGARTSSPSGIPPANNLLVIGQPPLDLFQLFVIEQYRHKEPQVETSQQNADYI